MGVETVSLIIASFVSGSLGIASLMRNFRSRLCVSFAMMCVFFFAHDTLSVIESFDPVVSFTSPRLHSLMALLMGPAALVFLEELVPQYYKRIRSVLWLYVPLIILFLVVMDIFPFDRIAPWLSVLAHAIAVLPAFVWMASLAFAEMETPLTRERLRLKYAFWGGAITILFFLTDALRFAGVPIAPLGTIARSLYLMYLFQTFIQKELMTSDEVVGKIALFGGVALILSTIYALLVSWVGNRPGLFFFNTLIASFVILVLFDPIRNLTSRFTRKVFLRRNQMVADELNSLSNELMGTLEEPIELSKRISTALKRCLGVENCSLYILDRDNLSYVRVASPSDVRQPAELAASNPLIEYMTLRRGRPFVFETIENDRDSFYSLQPQRFCQTCLDTMRTIGADFVIPFLHESRLVGFCTATTGERILLSNERLRLFIPVSRQIALLLRNAQALTTLRDRDKLAAVGEMAAGLAHEIKNPLGAIKGAAQLLKENLNTNGNSKDFLDIVLAETDRLSSVVTEFLDYAKPRRNYPQTSCNPLRVIEHTAALVLRDSKVKIDIQSEKEGITLEADPEILKQVLLNLLLNAIQATEGFTDNPILNVIVREVRPRRGVLGDSIPIHKVWEGWDIKKLAPPHPFVEIEVRDNGSGICADDRSRIFVPFFTTKPKGTGLGLAICSRLVESMGGSISFRPNHPQGTIFTIHLPIRPDGRENKDRRELELNGKRWKAEDLTA